MSKKKKESKEEKRFHEEVVTQLLTLSTAGFGLVAALAWNQAIQSFVKEFIVPRVPVSGIISQVIYALIITFFAVFITYHLSKLHSHFSEKK